MKLEQKLAYRLPDLVEMFGFSKPSIYRWIKDNSFPKPIKVGRLSLWPVAIIDTWWREQQPS
jgi:prophage regulatory protein